jgi:hypothetical protein
VEAPSDKKVEDQFSDEEIDQLRKVLVDEGHPFQYRALQEANVAFSKIKGWVFSVPEFPVQAGRDTRVDFVLSDREIDLAVECKRVNPAYTRCWLFAHAPLTRRPPRGPTLIYEGVKRDSPDKAEALVRIVRATRPTYQIGYAVPTDRKGKLKDTGRDAVEKTLRQAAMAAIGLLNYYIDSPGAIEFKRSRYVIPVVITTADLVVTEIDLADKVSLEDGYIEADDLQPKRADWILYEYHIEPGLRHPIHGQLRSPDLSKALDQKYTRTIPIVTAGAIRDFLSRFNYEMITD